MITMPKPRSARVWVLVLCIAVLATACGGPSLKNAYRDPDGYFQLKYPEGYKVETLDVGPHKAPAIFMPADAKRLDQADRFFTADVSSLYESKDAAMASFRDSLQASGRTPDREEEVTGKHAQWSLIHFTESSGTGFMAFCQGPESVHLVTFRWELDGEEAELLKTEFRAVLDYYQPVK